MATNTSITPALQAEIKRKAENNIPLSTPTAAATALYNQYKTPTNPTNAAVSTTPSTPSTNGVAVSIPNGTSTPSKAATSMYEMYSTPAVSTTSNYTPNTSGIAVDRSLYGNYGSGTSGELAASQNLLKSGTMDEISAAIADALSKKQNNERAGYDTSPASQWLAKLYETKDARFPTQTNTTVDPYARSLESILNDATAQGNKGMAELIASVNAAKAKAQSDFDYNTRILTENRSKQDGAFNRNVSPFSGQYEYGKTELARLRELEDTERLSQLTSLLGGYDQQVSTAQSNLPAQIQELYNNLVDRERDYSLNSAGVTGYLNGNPTFARQQFDQGVKRDEVADQQWQKAFDSQNAQWKAEFERSGAQWKAEFDQNAKQFGQEFALRKLAQDHNMTLDQAQLAISQQNANTSSYSAQTSRMNQQSGVDDAALNRLYDTWDRTGFAPAGIPGVTEGTPLYSKGNSSSNQISSKDSTNNYNVLMDDLSQKGVDKATARRLLEANSGYLTDSDYSKLSSYINENF